MSDMIDLALTYGGFTSLDRQYLQSLLAKLPPEKQLAFITPPPSVINAYFSEIYQKQGPEAATDYYLDLSIKLNLLTKQPSFREEKPFVRLNLLGKSYGFVYENQEEVAQVFSEEDEVITLPILLELAQVFPQYKIFVEDAQIKMTKKFFDEDVVEVLTPESALLSQVTRLQGNVIKVSSFNQEELADLLKNESDQIYYSFEQRQFIAYVQQY